MSKARTNFRRPLLATATTAALALWSQGAVADDASGQAASAKRQDATTIEVVTVTAQKRTENARDVSSSISVVGSQQLENQHVNSLADLAGSLPGVQIENGGSPGRTAISMRGISSLDVGSVIGTYIDDTPLGSSSSFAAASRYQLDLLPYDLERIEVLRGPQGTLYGAGSMGGLLKYVMREPDMNTLSGRVGGGLAHIDGASGTGWTGRASVNVPLIKDELAMTASLSQNRTPGYIDNLVTGKNGINDVTQQSGRVALLWKPNADVQLKLSALHQTVDADDLGVILLDPRTQQPLYGERGTGTVIAEPFSNQVNFYSATLNWDLHWADFTSATGYSASTSHTTKDDTVVYGPVFAAYGYNNGQSGLYLDLNLKKATQEFRLASKAGGDIEWLGGLFYTHESSKNAQLLTAKSATGAPLPGLDPLLVVDLPSTYREAALFGDLTYKLSEQFDITGGLRYARNEQDHSYGVSGIGAALTGLKSSGGESAENVTTWMFSPRYRIDKNNMVYLRVATGYRPGSPNLALPGVPTVVNSDRLTNYEAGWKTSMLQRKLNLNLALYEIRWKDIQINNSTPQGVAYLANAGTASSRGGEASLSWTPVNTLRLALNSSYTQARLTEDAPTLKGKDGDTLPGIPRWNWSTSADYYFSLSDAWSGHVGADYRWIDKRRSSFENNPDSYRQGSYQVLNLNADVSRGIWTMRVYAKNLNNAKPQLNIGYLGNGATGVTSTLQSSMLQPRTIGIEFDTQF
jgi:outer membrane receptor protein involved in Fe transport